MVTPTLGCSILAAVKLKSPGTEISLRPMRTTVSLSGMDGLEDFRGGLLNDGQRFGEGCLVSCVELDVVAAGRVRIQADRARHDEGDGFGLGLPHRLRGLGPAFSQRISARCCERKAGSQGKACQGRAQRARLDP